MADLLDRSLPRAVHPGAWWAWALGLATAASRTTNPLLLALVLVVAGTVVSARRSQAPWSRAFSVFLKLGLVVVLIRVVAQTLFAPALPGSVLLSLPELPLPDWAAGVSLGGDVTLPSLMIALVDGLRLATVLACIGAANALANPKRLLAAMPAVLYELGVAVVIALSFAPSLVASVQRIRDARRLRGRRDRGLRGMLTVAMPVLEDALERSLALAAAMDSRGYGRRFDVPAATHRLTGALTLLGLLGTCLGLYGLLDGTGPAAMGVPLLLVGLAVATGGLVLGGRGSTRTRYRPDPWRAPEWCALAAGILAAGGTLVTGWLAPASLVPDLVPLAGLPLPVPATVGLLAGLSPAWLTPLPVDAGDRGPAGRLTPVDEGMAA